MSGKISLFVRARVTEPEAIRELNIVRLYHYKHHSWHHLIYIYILSIKDIINSSLTTINKPDCFPNTVNVWNVMYDQIRPLFLHASNKHNSWTLVSIICSCCLRYVVLLSHSHKHTTAYIKCSNIYYLHLFTILISQCALTTPHNLTSRRHTVRHDFKPHCSIRFNRNNEIWPAGRKDLKSPNIIVT